MIKVFRFGSFGRGILKIYIYIYMSCLENINGTVDFLFL